MKLETKRLILRKPKKSDWRDVYEGLNDKEVARNLKPIHPPYLKKDAKKWIDYLIKEWRKKNKDHYAFFIELKEKKKVIGETGIYNIKGKNFKGTTGSWINKKYWRKGYILEAKVTVLDFAFNKLKLKKLETDAYNSNVASNNMSKKLGFKFEGIRKKSFKSKVDGKIHDVRLYGLFKKDWKKVRPKIVKEVNEKIKRLEK